jgi:hypothetical protein
VDAALNEGLRLFALMTLCIERTVVLKLQPGDSYYSILEVLPDWLLPLRCRCHVFANGITASLWDAPTWDEKLFDELAPNSDVTMTRVRPARLADVAALNRSWMSDRNATVKRYGCLGLDLLFVHPAPSAIGTSIELTYAAAPAELAIDEDTPEIAEEDHQALVHFAAATLQMNHGGSEVKQFADESLRFLDLVQHRADLVRARFRTAGYDREPFEVKAYDRSILIAMLKEKKQKRAA